MYSARESRQSILKGKQSLFIIEPLTLLNIVKLKYIVALTQDLVNEMKNNLFRHED